jgi:hypothetical protein
MNELGADEQERRRVLNKNGQLFPHYCASSNRERKKPSSPIPVGRHARAVLHRKMTIPSDNYRVANSQSQSHPSHRPFPFPSSARFRPGPNVPLPFPFRSETAKIEASGPLADQIIVVLVGSFDPDGRINGVGSWM